MSSVRDRGLECGLVRRQAAIGSDGGVFVAIESGADESERRPLSRLEDELRLQAPEDVALGTGVVRERV